MNYFFLDNILHSGEQMRKYYEQNGIEAKGMISSRSKAVSLVENIWNEVAFLYLTCDRSNFVFNTLSKSFVFWVAKNGLY